MPIPSIEIEAVKGKRDLGRFVMLPWKIYKGDPHWVPPLIGDTKAMLDPAKNPFFKHAEAELFIASRQGEPVGRIAAIVNHRHNEFHGEKTAFFGFLETIDDPKVSGALLETARRWAGARGMERLRGPASFSTNEECALLVDGFDSPPAVMMPYNPPYYATLIEAAGFVKVKDLVAYFVHESDIQMERLEKFAKAIQAKEGVTVRKIDKKRLGIEVDRFRSVYNQAWERNWGFVPMTDEEIAHMAKSLKPVIDPEIVLFLEKEGNPVGFALALPDVNQAVRHANGRLFPLGLAKILFYARRIHKARVLVLGLLKEYRGRGLDIVLYLTLIRNGTRKGYDEGEFSWILEDNMAIRRPLERIGAKVYKTYRFYERPIDRA
jgi:GNAT superfamily N-acetyltransferase